MVSHTKAAVQADPDNLRYSNYYQWRYATINSIDESNFFSALSKQRSIANITIEVALSYVDMMRSCSTPPDGLVCQAQILQTALLAYWIKCSRIIHIILLPTMHGLYHLYWPTLMGHLPKAQVDLQYAVALSKVSGQH